MTLERLNQARLREARSRLREVLTRHQMAHVKFHTVF